MAKTRSSSRSASKTQFEQIEPLIETEQITNMSNEGNPDHNGDSNVGINLDTASNEEKLNYMCRRLDELTELKQVVKNMKKEPTQKDLKIQSLESRVHKLE